MAAGVEGVASRAAPDGHSVGALHAQTSAAVGDRLRPTAAAAAEVRCGAPPAAARPQRARRAGGATASEGGSGRGAAGRRRRTCRRGECGRHARGAGAAPPTASFGGARWQAGTASATGLLVGAVGGGQGTGGSAAAQSPPPPPSSGERLAPRGRGRPVPAAATVFAGWGHLTAAAPCVCVCGFRVRGGACRTSLLKKDKNAGECRDGHRSPAWPCHVGERRGWVFSVGRHGLAPSPLHVYRRAYIHGYKCSSPPPPSLRACWRGALPPARAKRPALLHGAGGASARTHTSLHTRHRPRGTRRPTGGRGGIRSLESFVSRSSEFLDPP